MDVVRDLLKIVVISLFAIDQLCFVTSLEQVPAPPLPGVDTLCVGSLKWEVGGGCTAKTPRARILNGEETGRGSMVGHQTKLLQIEQF